MNANRNGRKSSTAEGQRHEKAYLHWLLDLPSVEKYHLVKTVQRMPTASCRVERTSLQHPCGQFCALQRPTLRHSTLTSLPLPLSGL